MKSNEREGRHGEEDEWRKGKNNERVMIKKKEEIGDKENGKEGMRTKRGMKEVEEKG